MRTLAIWAAVFSATVGSAWAQDSNSADEVRKGHQLAAMLCGTCHVAAADQPFEPILQPPAPAFTSIVQRKDVTPDWLQKFLNTTHRGLDNPKGMPNPYLTDYQIAQVIAYLMSLRN